VTYRFLTDLAAVVRSSGLPVVELPGWQTRGRPASTGSFDPMGVLCHHTGGTPDSREYAQWLATVGRSDLPAPLCHLALDREGTVYVVAAGRANHAGECRGSGPIPAGDGNALLVGIEAMNTGSEGWTDVQREAYARLCAALCRGYGWPASHVRAHRETSTTGKWDPGLLDMDAHRAEVARFIDNPQEDDVAWSDDLPKINVPESKDHKGDSLQAGQTLAQARGFAAAAYASSLRAERAVQALAKALGPEVSKAVEAALADAVVDVNVTVGGESK
jgi:hypothetical protein